MASSENGKYTDSERGLGPISPKSHDFQILKQAPKTIYFSRHTYLYSFNYDSHDIIKRTIGKYNSSCLILSVQIFVDKQWFMYENRHK